jgi:hypothetical protein
MRYIFHQKLIILPNLLSDSDGSDDEFDSSIISYSSNFIINESLSNFRFLIYLDSSTKILKDRINEFDKMISNYQTKINEFERTKLELSKYKDVNDILKVKVHTLVTEKI